MEPELNKWNRKRAVGDSMYVLARRRFQVRSRALKQRTWLGFMFDEDRSTHDNRTNTKLGEKNNTIGPCVRLPS